MLRALITLFAGLIVATAPAAGAAEYPTHPVTLVVGAPTGTPPDLLARAIGKRLEEILHKPFVIENRPGALGAVAAAQAAVANPDGYTLLMANNNILVTNAALFKDLDYDPQKDFVPISLIGVQANVLVVNPQVPANDLSQLIALAKASPGQLNFASSGYGAAAHLSGELFKKEAGINIVHVAYKSVAAALHDVIVGHVQMMFAPAPNIAGPLRNNRVRALAVTTPRRTAYLPDLPTLAELGLKDFDIGTWHGLVAPAGTPKAILETLNLAATEALKDPETQRTLHELGIDPIGSTEKDFDAVIKAEVPKWAAVAKIVTSRVD